MDDEELIYPFYEKLNHGVKILLCTRLAIQTSQAGETDFTHPDIKSLKDHPEINFVVYHSGFRDQNMNLPPEDTYLDENAYLPYTTDLCKDRIENPHMSNVYMELGTTFGHTVITHQKYVLIFLGK